MSCSTGWQACRDQRADRLAHVPADYTALMLANVEDAKVVQERMCHCSARITMGVYAQAVTLAKRKAQGKVVAMQRDGEKKSG